MASRFHAMIGPRPRKFALKDQSTNGTYVSMQGSPVVVLKREELPLFGEGVISLGEAVREDGEHLIRFAFD
ncbi:MAG: FHA domain-containing protein [Gammaproteobacteria bacterium]|nr:FHA domain-containing protein [Gammaproteobacteria bacterium]